MAQVLSILIPTIDGREAQLNKLLCNIGQQIKQHDLKKKIQILLFKDKQGEHSIGLKRNWLYQNALGKWSMSIDDDDDIEKDCLRDLIKLLETKDPDAISIWGLYTKDGGSPQKFHHSIAYHAYTEINGFFQRPPGHINPIRTSIAKKFSFLPINHGEDTDWAMAMSRAGAIKTEAAYEKMYYFYNYSSVKPTVSGLIDDSPMAKRKNK